MHCRCNPPPYRYQDQSKIWYHSTSQEALSDILENGIKINQERHHTDYIYDELYGIANDSINPIFLSEYPTHGYWEGPISF